MMSKEALRQLKELATENGIKFAPNAGESKLRELLEQGGFQIPEDMVFAETKQSPPEPIPSAPEGKKTLMTKSAAELKNEFEELAAQYSEIDQNPDITSRTVIRRRIGQALASIKGRLKDGHFVPKNPVNKKLLMEMLDWERSRDVITDAERYVLHAMEEEDCKLTCQNYRRLDTGHYAVEGREYRYKKHFDSGRKMDVYQVYIGFEKDSNEQITPSIARRLEMGFQVPEHEYPPPKRLVRLSEFNAKEFAKYFRTVY